MANQPPVRPWFRVLSMRPAAPAPAPAAAPAPAPAPATEITAPPQPRPFRPIAQPPPPRAPGAVASVPTSPARTPAVPTGIASSVPPSPVPRQPTISSVPTSPVAAPKPAPATSSVQSSPLRKPAPTTSSVPSSPAPKPVLATSSVPSSPIRAVPAPSPRTIGPAVETPPQSPKTKPTAPPPSPLILPPSQFKSEAEPEPKIPLEAEQKTVLVQKTVDKPSKLWFNGIDSSRQDSEDSTLKPRIGLRGKQEPPKDKEVKETGRGKKTSSDSEDMGTRIITIAGENRGALMELFRSPKKNTVLSGNPHHLHNRGNPKSDSSSSSGEEGNTKMKGERSNRGRAKGATPMSAFMNSNVQGINNSIMFNSSCTHHDPGVHLALSRKPAGGGFHVKDRSNGYQS